MIAGRPLRSGSPGPSLERQFLFNGLRSSSVCWEPAGLVVVLFLAVFARQPDRADSAGPSY